jgi:hypothetical protein
MRGRSWLTLEADVEDCKKKMQSLLSSLRREKAKVSNSQRTGKGTITLMDWFEILKKVLKTRVRIARGQKAQCQGQSFLDRNKFP